MTGNVTIANRSVAVLRGEVVGGFMGRGALQKTHHMKTAWHPLLVVLLEHLLPRRWYRLIPELQLTKEPQRVDTVIIRRRRSGAAPLPTHLSSVLSGLAEHTLLHFKGPTDELDGSDALQLLGYVAQYMLIEGISDPRRVCFRVIAPTVTPRFLAQIRHLGGDLEETATRGIHEGRLFVFPMRAVETAVAWPNQGDHLLYTLAPQYVDRPQEIPALDDEERLLFHFLVQCVDRFRKDPNWRTLMKDASKVDQSFTDAWLKVLRKIPLEQRFAGLTPEERFAGLTPEERFAGLTPAERLAGLDPAERLAGLDPAERLAGLDPAERLAGLSETEQVLALPAHLLKALSDDYIATLPADVQATVRTRRGH